jgi:glutathione S-transferase
MAETAASGKIKVYADLGSPFSRAVILFCRVNGIEYEYVHISIMAGQTRTPEFSKINPMQRLPCIDEDGFKLGESVTIMRYLATTRNVADHWYPKDPKRRAVIDSILEWIPLNITVGWGPLLVSRVMAKIPGVGNLLNMETDEKLEARSEKILHAGLDLVETVLLSGPGKFLENGDEVSLADIVLLCQLKQLKVSDAKTQEDILGSRAKIAAWMDAVENATNPHFEEVHKEIYAIAEKVEGSRKMATSQ